MIQSTITSRVPTIINANIHLLQPWQHFERNCPSISANSFNKCVGDLMRIGVAIAFAMANTTDPNVNSLPRPDCTSNHIAPLQGLMGYANRYPGLDASRLHPGLVYFALSGLKVIIRRGDHGYLHMQIYRLYWPVTMINHDPYVKAMRRSRGAFACSPNV